MHRQQLSDEFHERTIQAWQPYGDRPLTHDDAREITENLVGFVCILLEWEVKERTASNSASDRPDTDTNRRAT